MKNTHIKQYIHQLQQAYYGGNWLDEDMEKKLKKVNEQNAWIKPMGYVHSIAEVTSHLVVWRKELMERMKAAGPAKLTDESPDNWIPNEVLIKNGWVYLKKQLDDSQTELIAFLEQQDDAFLESIWSGNITYEWFVIGLVEHDIYHLGQIGLIYKMVIHDTITQYEPGKSEASKS